MSQQDSSSIMHLPLDVIPINVVVYRFVDGDFIFVDMNEAAQKTEQVDKAKLIGKRVTEVFPGVKKFGLFDILLSVFKNGGTQEVELGVYQDERISGWRQNRVSRLENGDIVALYTDMSVQKHLEKEKILLEEQLQSLGAIVDDSMNEVYIFDSANMKFTYANKKAQRNLGYTLQEMKEMTPPDIKPPYNKEIFAQLMKPLLEGTQDSAIFETIYQRKNGTLYDVEIRLQAMNVQNKKQFIVFVNDITQRKAAEMKLVESEEKFRQIAENSLMGIFIYQETFMYANQAFLDSLGYGIDELSSMKPWKIIEKEQQEEYKHVALRRLKGDKFPREYSDVNLVTKSGQKKIMRISTQTIQYNGSHSGMGTVIDVTDLKETKQQLKLLAHAIEQMDELVRITDKDGMISYVNDALVAHTGYKKVELIGKDISMFRSGVHDQAFYENLWSTILSGKTFKSVFSNRKKNKQLYYEEEIITPILDENNKITHFIVTGQDISQRVAMEKELQKLATTDSLTGIYNRYKLNKELEIEISKSERYNSNFAVMMIDIDNFKSVNDTHGHDVGDYVLQELSNIVSNFIRESDVFGRWGGEEFIVLLPYSDKKKVLVSAEKLRAAVSCHAFKDMPFVTISVGVSVFTKEDTKESLLKRVDKALYQAKKDGRNKVVFE